MILRIVLAFVYLLCGRMTAFTARKGAARTFWGALACYLLWPLLLLTALVFIVAEDVETQGKGYSEKDEDECAHRNVEKRVLKGGDGPDDAAEALTCNDCGVWGWRYCDGTVSWR
jgi:hypothetical protein